MTVKESVYESLYDSGEKMTVAELQEEIKVDAMKLQIRESLKELNEEGFVQRHSGGGENAQFAVK